MNLKEGDPALVCLPVASPWLLAASIVKYTYNTPFMGLF